MFDLRVNSKNDRKNKAKINYKNWEDIVKYPEHKNKSKDLINEKDLEANIQLIDKTEEFKEDVKRFTRDQRWHNKNRTKNIKRDSRNEQQMEEWLLDKQVATNYTVQENNIFFQKKFNGDRNKIIEFYKKSMDSIFEASGIDKKRIIYATIHFDQSNPHLHFSISNIHSTWNKEHKKVLYAVNSKKYNPVNIFKDQQNARKAWIFNNKLSEIERKKFKSKEFQNIFKTKYAEKLNFQKPILKVLNKKYDSKIYANAKDHISMQRVRGYKRNVSSEQLNTLAWHNLKNKFIFKFRETKLKKELESAKKLINDPKILIVKKLKFQNQYNTLERKYKESINNKNYSLKPNIPEQNMLNKKKYFLRKDIDLEIIFGKNAFAANANEIHKNRFYNKLLYLCHEQNMTPQALAQSLYYGKYIPKKYKDKNLDMVQKTILRTTNPKYDEAIKEDKNIYLNIRKRMENAIDQNIEKLRIFVNVDNKKALVNELEKNKSTNIGINSNFIKAIKLNSVIQKNRHFKSIPVKYKNTILTSVKFQESINNKIEKMSYTSNNSFKKYSRSSNLASLLDSLDYSAQKELEVINKLQERNKREIEWENDL